MFDLSKVDAPDVSALVSEAQRAYVKMINAEKALGRASAALPEADDYLELDRATTAYTVTRKAWIECLNEGVTYGIDETMMEVIAGAYL